MKFKLSDLLKMNAEPSLVVLLGAEKPNQNVLDVLSKNSDLIVREAFTTRGVLQDLPGVHLVILDELISLADTSTEVLHRALEMSGIPVVSQKGFLADASHPICLNFSASLLIRKSLPSGMVSASIQWMDEPSMCCGVKIQKGCERYWQRFAESTHCLWWIVFQGTLFFQNYRNLCQGWLTWL